ncbi:CaiB/BaiF CoA transferase family protein [Marivita geojedonensis]|uniref:CoA-transferase n=1 Tax=Marivita geojedonensis TaxID=1123756 RepID=A0A1X4NFC2_9RHOB|nr:CaiB/BaiF CoA-transferase family protein [Marivita geojedonensis]OSQ45637.1 CoA-transferase [Marivita geojedonensis]PRY73974.1 crotonobetainyl-CoA:carnitine CoA-transferase CaiB-like acyl-CoA transferase [Marivita geojedonensis]
MTDAPLTGFRILEVEGIGPGPFAAMMLADLGADVIVVHRPRSGPVAGLRERPVTDRGKRSIVLDLKNEADRKDFLKLVDGADGLIEGFRPGVMERLGLGPEACHAVNPRLVYGRMTGWGQTGPMAHQAGHDLNYISLAGALWSSATGDARPTASPTLVGDIGGGALYLVAGMLSGLLAAGRTGRGTVVDAAICDGAAHMQNLLQSIDGGVDDGPSAVENPLVGAHWSRTYCCADGRYMSVQCLEPKFYAQFLEILDLAADADFAERQFDASAWPRLSARLERLFAGKDSAYWTERFEGTDACVAPVLSPREAFLHPHNAARQTWHDTADGLQAAAAPRFDGLPSRTPAEIRDRGADTETIRSALAQGSGWPDTPEA